MNNRDYRCYNSYFSFSTSKKPYSVYFKNGCISHRDRLWLKSMDVEIIKPFCNFDSLEIWTRECWAHVLPSRALHKVKCLAIKIKEFELFQVWEGKGGHFDKMIKVSWCRSSFHVWLILLTPWLTGTLYHTSLLHIRIKEWWGKSFGPF